MIHLYTDTEKAIYRLNTFILPCHQMVLKILKSKKDTVGIRVCNVICKRILETLDNPILSTSLPGKW